MADTWHRTPVSMNALLMDGAAPESSYGSDAERRVQLEEGGDQWIWQPRELLHSVNATAFRPRQSLPAWLQQEPRWL